MFNNRAKLFSKCNFERQGVNILLKMLRIVLPIIVFVFAGYSLISGNHEVMPYMMFFMGAMLLVMGHSRNQGSAEENGY